VVAKRADAPYRSGRSEAWVKVKCVKSETFPIVAFVEKLGARPRKVASLYVGKREGGKPTAAAQCYPHARFPHPSCCLGTAFPVRLAKLEERQFALVPLMEMHPISHRPAPYLAVHGEFVNPRKNGAARAVL